MKRVLLCTAIALTVTLASLSPVLPGSSTGAIAQQSQDIQRNFAGVSFSQPADFGEIIWGYSPNSTEAVPGGGTRRLYPDYSYFEFIRPYRGEIRIYPVDEYEAFSPDVKGSLDTLKNLLDARGQGQTFPPLPLSPSDVIYSPQPAQGQPVVRGKVSYLPMRNGSGERFIGGYAEQGQPVTERGLYYVFLGLSLDGLHYIDATFEQPLSITLPDPPATGSPNYAAEVEAYNQAVADKINSAPDSEFNPALDKLDALFKTMQVGRYRFPQTGKTIQGRFYQYWNRNGGLEQQGYPITEEMQEKSDTDGKVYTVQYFERAVFEYHPENQPPNDVLLSLLGVFNYNDKYNNDKYHGNAPDQKASTVNARYFPETGKTLGGAFRQYWETHGGLAQQGYPISDEFQEVSQTDGKQYTVQYFQRAVFEYHTELAGTPNEVLLSLLGAFYFDKKHNGH